MSTDTHYPPFAAREERDRIGEILETVKRIEAATLLSPATGGRVKVNQAAASAVLLGVPVDELYDGVKWLLKERDDLREELAKERAK